MNLESQCCSLELSKRLKELGVKSESFFHWYVSHRSGYSFILESKEVNYCVDSKDNYDVYSAYTVAELGLLLPKELWHPSKHRPMICRPANRLCHWVVYYDKDLWTEESTEANARAAMLIKLIEQGLVKYE